ncbi:MAG: U32 family peptidase [Gammaproteobacteria bacterium]|nr:U32 family peptidase [Gammaproteobacteria bacterium]
MELVAPAGNLPSLKAAADNGADAVYIGLRNETNARHFPGLNFTEENIAKAAYYAHVVGTRVFLALNTYPQPQGLARWRRAVDIAAEAGLDAVIVADIGLMEYARTRYPQLALHLSVQASATNRQALAFYRQEFGIRRAVLPRVLSLAQVKQLAGNAGVDLEVFGFGSLCIMAEGRCQLSSYATGKSPNTYGACSPAHAVRWEQGRDGLDVRLNGVLIDRIHGHEPAGYPVVCKGRFRVGDSVYHALEEPTSLNTLELLPELARAGIQAIKLEGRQRNPAYVAQITRIWRNALDVLAAEPDGFAVRGEWMAALDAVSEGARTTLGAYHRPWQ